MSLMYMNRVIASPKLLLALFGLRLEEGMLGPVGLHPMAS